MHIGESLLHDSNEARVTQKHVDMYMQACDITRHANLS